MNAPRSSQPLPPGWRTVRFGDVVRNVRETVRDPLAQGLERYVGLEHVEPENLHVKTWGLVAEGTTFTQKFVAGQVLFGKRRAYQHKAAVAEFDGVCSGDLLVFEPKDDRLLAGLLPFIVQSEGFFAHALRTSAGSLSPRTRWKDLAAYEFPLPPLDEQRRIAAILWAADAENCALCDVADSFERLVSVAGLEIFGNDSLETVSLGKLASDGSLEFQTGPFGTVLKASSYVDEGTPVVNPVNMIDGKIVTTDGPFLDEDECQRLAQYRAMTGDILLGRKGEVGRAVYIAEDYRGYIVGSDIIRLRLSPGAPLESSYLYCFFRSFPARSWLARHASGTTMPGINERILSRLEVPVPDRSEQKHIVEVFSEFDRASDILQAKIESSTSLMRSLINRFLG